MHGVSKLRNCTCLPLQSRPEIARTDIPKGAEAQRAFYTARVAAWGELIKMQANGHLALHFEAETEALGPPRQRDSARDEVYICDYNVPTSDLYLAL